MAKVARRLRRSAGRALGTTVPGRDGARRLRLAARTSRTLGACVLVAGMATVLFTAEAQASTSSRATAAPSNPLTVGHSYRHGVVPSLTWVRSHRALSSAIFDSANNLSYSGGIGGVGVTTGAEQVYLVFWGSQWGTQSTNANGDATFSGDPSAISPDLQEFFKGLGTGGESWSGVMTQYCEGVTVGSQDCPGTSAHVAYPTGGALAGVWEDASSPAPAQASAHQVGVEAVSAAAHFGNTTAASNRDTQYVIVSPTGTDPDSYETQGFCAWHDFTGDSSMDGGGAVTGAGTPLAFTNLPYLPDAGAGCGQNFVNSGPAGLLDGVTIVEGHEYAETITDQFPAGGWLDSSGEETGDKCAWISSGQGAAQDITLATGSFAVQSTWANDFGGGTGGCEASHPIVTNGGGNTVTVTNPGNQTTTDGSTVSLQIDAVDSASGQTLTYGASGLPTGLSINASSGLISGTPTSAGPFGVTVTATDTTSVSGSAKFSWTVGAAALTITASSGSFNYGSRPPAITAGYSGFANGDTSASLTEKPTCSTTATNSSPVGSYPSSCTGAVDANYTISYAAGSVTVHKAGQSIALTSTAPTNAKVGGPTYKVTATGGGSGNPVAFTVAPSSALVCVVLGSTVSFTEAGTCLLDANQAGDADYNAAAQAQQSFTVAAASKSTTKLSFTTPVTYGAENRAEFHITVTGSNDTPVGSVAVKRGSATLCAVKLSAGRGTCTLSKTQLSAGTYSILAVYTPSSSSFLGSGSAAARLVVKKAPTAITAAAPAATVTGGTARVKMFATLKSLTTGGAVKGQSITFALKTSVGSVTCKAISNSSGVATCTVTVSLSRWQSSRDYAAAFGGSADYGASSANRGFAKPRG